MTISNVIGCCLIAMVIGACSGLWPGCTPYRMPHYRP